VYLKEDIFSGYIFPDAPAATDFPRHTPPGAPLTKIAYSDSLIWQKEVLFLTYENIVVIIKANIGQDDKEKGESAVRDAA